MTVYSVEAKPASLFRRLGALCYDSLLLLGVLFIAAIPLTFFALETREDVWVENFIRLYLIAVCFIYFGWFWGHGGQTLGMRAWKLHLIRDDGGKLGWSHFAKRFLTAWVTLGFGNLTILFSNKKHALQDTLSSSVLVYRPSVNNNR